MHVESLVNGNEFPFKKHHWDDSLVTAADRRYAEIINGPRVNQVPRYIPPTESERKQGFCPKVLGNVDHLRLAAESAGDARDEGWYLMKCQPEQEDIGDDDDDHDHLEEKKMHERKRHLKRKPEEPLEPVEQRRPKRQRGVCTTRHDCWQ